jgi:hypothetical protein
MQDKRNAFAWFLPLGSSLQACVDKPGLDEGGN